MVLEVMATMEVRVGQVWEVMAVEAQEEMVADHLELATMDVGRTVHWVLSLEPRANQVVEGQVVVPSRRAVEV